MQCHGTDVSHGVFRHGQNPGYGSSILSDAWFTDSDETVYRLKCARTEFNIKILMIFFYRGHGLRLTHIGMLAQGPARTRMERHQQVAPYGTNESGTTSTPSPLPSPPRMPFLSPPRRMALCSRLCTHTLFASSTTRSIFDPLGKNSMTSSKQTRTFALTWEYHDRIPLLV